MKLQNGRLFYFSATFWYRDPGYSYILVPLLTEPHLGKFTCNYIVNYNLGSLFGPRFSGYFFRTSFSVVSLFATYYFVTMDHAWNCSVGTWLVSTNNSSPFATSISKCSESSSLPTALPTIWTLTKMLMSLGYPEHALTVFAMQLRVEVGTKGKHVLDSSFADWSKLFLKIRKAGLNQSIRQAFGN